MTGFLHRLVAPFLGQGGRRTAGLDAGQVARAVADLTNGDDGAESAAQRALRGDFTPDDPFLELAGDLPVFAALGAGLHHARRVAVIDWAASLPEAAAELAEIFAHQGLVPDPTLSSLGQLPDPKRGRAVGLAFAAFRAQAEPAGMRLIGLNSDSDTCIFVLTPATAAARWSNVRIEGATFIEDVDWQYAKELAASGQTARSTKHPARSERASP